MLKQILSKIPRKSFKSDNGDLMLNTNMNGSGNGTTRAQNGNAATGKANATKRTSSAVFPTSVVAGIEPLVSFKDAPNSEKMNLFLSKLNLCCVTFDFYDPSKNTSEKDIKHQTLIELVDFVASGLPSKFPEPAIFAMSRMCSAFKVPICSLPISQNKRYIVRDGLPVQVPSNPIALLQSNILSAQSKQLSYCITQFIDKEPKLTSTVIKGLLKYWPITNSQKEVMFLGELEQKLEATNMLEFQKIMIPLFSRIACCINSYHFQVKVADDAEATSRFV